MLTREQAGDIFDRIRRLSSADEVEVLFSGGAFALTRFANNTIHQNVTEENHVVSVRTVFGQRTARATTNKFDDESLRQVVRSSESLAKVQHPDPDLLPMPTEEEAAGHSPSLTGGAGEVTASASFIDDLGADSLDPVELVMAVEEAFEIKIPDEDAEKIRTVQDAVDYIGKHAKAAAPRVVPSRYFEQTAGITPELRADGVKKIVGVADRHRLMTAGVFSSAESFEGIFNTRGLSRWHTQTSAEVSITMLAADSSGWQKANSPDIANLDSLRLAEIAAQKAVESAHPKEVPAGKYTVILEPAAVLDIVGFMFWDYSGMAILDQRSFLTGRIGTKLFGENVTIVDDVAHPLQAGCPFDGEGVVRKRVGLVENGVVKRVVYARATGERMQRSEHKDSVGPIEATGHGFALPNEMGEMPLNIVFAPIDNPQTVDQMIASTERGILVTRLWYIREVEPFEKVLTGMTRDGTFLVENGQVKSGVRNFRFNESLIHMLSNVEAMSVPVRACGEESFDMVVPAMKVKEFNFTEVTKF